MKVSIPTVYGTDAYYARNLDIGFILRTGKRTMTLECTQEQIEEIISDAAYYSDTLGFDPCYYRICYSARRALRAIQKQLYSGKKDSAK